VQPRLEASPQAATELSEYAPSEDKNTRDRALAEWALLLAPLAQEMRSLGAKTPETMEARAAVAVPAPGSTAVSTALSQTSDTPVNDPGPSRLVLSITSETLGQIDLIIDRENGGVSISIGATTEAQSVISTDKFALLQNLAKSGVHVRSFGVMSREAVGTVLAEGKLSRREAAPHRQDSGTPDGKSRKRINLIG
jgi:hypothetical protein